MAFDLGAMLRDVSELDTGREQIEYIPLDLIDSDPNNFYQLTDIEKLADNISLCGLQQPIRVRQQEGGRYMIVSGHRRRAALEMLVAGGYEKFQEASCIVERDEASTTLQQLRLIYANANTRKLTPAEIGEQAVQVEKLLYQLKEEGYNFPGRMRDHVAEAVCASKTKLARLKVIRDNLADCWQEAWKSGTLGESVAYALAQQPGPWQQIIFDVHGEKPNYVYEGTVKEFFGRFAKITKIKCSHGFCNGCDNQTAMMVRSAKDRWNEPCRAGCCYDCSNLTSCKSSCAHCASLKADKKRIARESAQEHERIQAERDAPTLDLIRDVYRRVGQLRKERRISVEKLLNAQCKIYAVTDDDKQESLENGTAKISTNTTLPFGYSFYASNAKPLIRVADALGCSIDYLFGRTDCPDLAKPDVSEPDTGWKTGDPWNFGEYVVLVRYDSAKSPTPEKMQWTEDGWYMLGSPFEDFCPDAPIVGWMPMPEEE